MLRRSTKRLAALTFLFLLYLPALGSSSVSSHPDESYYLAISGEMHQRDTWFTPTLDDRPLWFKPPLLYWAARVCYSLFGQGFFAARLPAALATVALALLTGALARRMYGEKTELPAILLTGTLFGFVRYGRLAMMDAPLTLALALAAHGAWRAAEEDRPAALLWVGAGAGMASMLKGPVGALLVLLLAGGFLAARAPRLLTSRWTGAAFALGAAVGLPWFALSLARYGRDFYDFFVVGQYLDRFRHPWTWSGEMTLLGGFLALLLPWTFLFTGALPPLRRLREPGVLLPIFWIGSVLVTFSIPSLKWHHYGLSCAPAAVLLIVSEAPKRWARLATAATLSTLAALVWLTLRWPLGGWTLSVLATAGALFAAAAAFAVRGQLPAVAVSAGLALAGLVELAMPAINPPTLPEEAIAAVSGMEVCVDRYVPGVFTMSAGRRVTRCEGSAEVQRRLEGGAAVILPAPALADLPGDRSRLTRIARWRHVPGHLPLTTVWRSWLKRDPDLLFEEMAIYREGPGAAAE